MTKHMPPPMKMKVERGRLVPATAYDAERLDSYRIGSTVSVRFAADRMRPLERKYRAILGKVIKECKTPWSNTKAAHQALKLACGYVNVGRTKSGEFMQWPRSLVDFDDKEMEDYFESVLVLLHTLTGVDPETLRNETASVEEDEPHDPETGELINETSDPAPPLAGSDVGGTPLSANSPADVSQQPAGQPGPASEPAGSDLFGKFEFGPNELAYLKELAVKALDDADGDGDAPAKYAAIERLYLNYADVIESKGGREAMTAMGKSIAAVVNGKRTRQQAADYIARDILGCKAEELEGRK